MKNAKNYIMTQSWVNWVDAANAPKIIHMRAIQWLKFPHRQLTCYYYKNIRFDLLRLCVTKCLLFGYCHENTIRMRRISRKMYKITAISPAKHDSVKRLIQFAVHTVFTQQSPYCSFFLSSFSVLIGNKFGHIHQRPKKKTNNVNNTMETWTSYLLWMW